MSSKDVRRGIVNEKVNSEGFAFIIIEATLITIIFTYIAVMDFNWNLFATFIVTFILLLVLSLTKIYTALGILFSLGWGIGFFKLFYWATDLFGGSKWLEILLGIIGFLLATALSYSARESGKEYVDDIGQ